MKPIYDHKTTSFSDITHPIEIIYLSNFYVDFNFSKDDIEFNTSLLSENLLNIEMDRDNALIKCKFCLNIINDDLPLIRILETTNNTQGNIIVNLQKRDGTIYYKREFGGLFINI
jgi:hypothetical protein